MPTWNRAVTVVPSKPPLVDWTPVAPPGTRTVTLVRGLKPLTGTKVAASPLRCQVPGMAGVTAGIGEVGLNAAEKTTWMGAAPLTPAVPLVGVIDTTCSGVLPAALPP